MPTDFHPDPKRSARRRPRFAYQATVEVYRWTGPDSRPTARLAVSGWAWHRAQACQDIRHEAQAALHNLGLTREQIGELTTEPHVDAWWAIDPLHIRNPNNDMVPATTLVLNAEDQAQLRKTRCLVPGDWAESDALYGPFKS